MADVATKGPPRGLTGREGRRGGTRSPFRLPLPRLRHREGLRSFASPGAFFPARRSHGDFLAATFHLSRSASLTPPRTAAVSRLLLLSCLFCLGGLARPAFATAQDCPSAPTPGQGVIFVADGSGDLTATSRNLETIIAEA